MRSLLLGLAACAAFSGLAKGDVVVFYNTSTANQTFGTNNIDFVFTANNTSPSITKLKLFGTFSNSQTVTAQFLLVEASSTLTVTSNTRSDDGWLFDLTGTWSGTSLQNLGTGQYTLDIGSFSGNSGTTFNYDTTSSSAILTNPGYGLTGNNYVNATTSFARFEVYTVPEPGTLLLGTLAACSGGAGVWWKRRRHQPAQAETTDQPATV